MVVYKMNKLLLTLILLTGCASQGVARNDQNRIIKEFYASIKSINQVELSSDAKSGVAGGAVIGAINEADGNHERIIAGGIIGGLVGGLLTAFIEGSNKAYEYILISESEGEFSIIQKKLITTETGCVKISISSKAFISSALKENCNIKKT